MAFFTNITIPLVLACISHQLMMGSCQKGHGRRGRGVDRGQCKDRSGPKAGRRPKSVSVRPIKGKVLTEDKSECTWATTGEDLFILNVTPKKGDRSFSCPYAAKPSLCPQYAPNVKLYWKQIARAPRRVARIPLCAKELPVTLISVSVMHGGRPPCPGPPLHPLQPELSNPV